MNQTVIPRCFVILLHFRGDWVPWGMLDQGEEPPCSLWLSHRSHQYCCNLVTNVRINTDTIKFHIISWKTHKQLGCCKRQLPLGILLLWYRMILPPYSFVQWNFRFLFLSILLQARFDANVKYNKKTMFTYDVDVDFLQYILSYLWC